MNLDRATTPPLPLNLPRRLRRDRVLRSWMTAWLGAMTIGIGNAALRETAFEELPDLVAHQVSTATLIVFLALYMEFLQRRRPLPSRRVALRVGGLWALATIAFEFGLGLLVTRDTFADLVGAYNVLDGKIWALVPLWMFIGPELFRRATSKEI